MKFVYISSTYEDLIDERKAAFEAVRRLELESLGMEGYSAQETKPIEKCLQDVRQCSAYLGIVGWRYGSKPPGSEYSFTELEYREAGKQDIPRFIFLASERPRTLKDKDSNAIVAFRQLVRDAHIVKEFTTVDQLKYEVVAGLRSLGAEPPIPPLLPYQCDRDDQYDDLSTILISSEAPAQQPIVCLVHGHEQQAVNRFMQCVKERVPGFYRYPLTSP